MQSTNKSLLIGCVLATLTVLTIAVIVQKKKQKQSKPLISSKNAKSQQVSPFYLDYKTSKEKTNLGLCHIARTVCPELFKNQIDEQMSIDQIQGGITNLLWKITNDSGQSCLIRVYGENTEVMIDRNLENMVFYELSERNFGPKLYGRFQNGRVEGYFDAKSLDPCSKMGERVPVDFPILIAKQLARMHNIQDMPVVKEAQIWKMLMNFHKMATQVSFARDEQKSRQFATLEVDKFISEINWMQTVLPSPLNGHGKNLKNISSKAKSIAFRQVFSHNDLLGGNILYIQAEDRVQFIDFEYGGYNYAAFDVANHFCEHAGFDFDLKRWYPNEELQIHFWKAYIQAAGFQKDGEESEKLLQELVLWTNRFALLANALWFTWAILQAKYSVIDVDFLGFASRRRNGYFSQKAEFF